MVKSTVTDAVNFLEQRLKEEGLDVSKIILFGSQTEGKATDESDIDVLIISEDFQGKDIFQRAEMTKHAEIAAIKKFLIPFDIITLTPGEFESGSSIIAEYVKTGLD